MYIKLKECCYPELELGTYTHIANSFHCYERDFEKIQKRIDGNIQENRFPLPENWRVIGSNDIANIIDIKLNKQEPLFKEWQYPENVDFYDWLLS